MLGHSSGHLTVPSPRFPLRTQPLNGGDIIEECRWLAGKTLHDAGHSRAEAITIEFRNLDRIKCAFGGDVAFKIEQSVAHQFESLVRELGGQLRIERDAIGHWTVWTSQRDSFWKVLNIIKPLLLSLSFQPLDSGAFCVLPELHTEIAESTESNSHSSTVDHALGESRWDDRSAAAAKAFEVTVEQYKLDSIYVAALLADLQMENLVWGARRIVSKELVDKTLYQSAKRFRISDRGRYQAIDTELEALERMGVGRAYDVETVEWALAKLKNDPDLRLGISLMANSCQIDVWWGLHSEVLKNDPALATRLYIEIPAALKTEQLQRAIALCEILKALGVKIVIADFGGKGSNLSTIYTLLPDAVKISELFTRRSQSEANWRKAQDGLVALTSAFCPMVITEQSLSEPENPVASNRHSEWVIADTVSSLHTLRSLEPRRG